jgi:hypothetical protein
MFELFATDGMTCGQVWVVCLLIVAFAIACVCVPEDPRSPSDRPEHRDWF